MRKNAQPKLTKSQIMALLVTLRKELAVIFQQSPELDKIKEGPERKKTILDGLAYLIKDGYGVDPEDASIYEIFNPK